MKSKQLAVISPVDAVVVPKPTRTEVIAALVEVAKKEHEVEREQLKKDKEQAKADFERGIHEQLASNYETLCKLIGGGRIGAYDSGATVSITLPTARLTPANRQRLKKLRALESTSFKSFDPYAAKLQIGRKLDGLEEPSARIAKLAGSQEVAALWKALSKQSVKSITA